MTVAIAHAAPTAPAPIIPIFMMGPRLRLEFSMKTIGQNGRHGRRNFQHCDNARAAAENCLR
jgi:hypothetical protein